MSFDDFQFNDHIAGAIRRCGFTTPTPIQQQALGSVLARREMLGPPPDDAYGAPC